MFLLMKRDRNLYSRREFFKKATKGILPIIGGLTILSNPFVAKATTSTYCNGCLSTCMGTCRFTCLGQCARGCDFSCVNNCYSCTGSCRGSCSAECVNVCNGSCSYGCHSTCHSTCVNQAAASQMSFSLLWKIS